MSIQINIIKSNYLAIHRIANKPLFPEMSPNILNPTQHISDAFVPGTDRSHFTKVEAGALLVG